MIIGGALVGLLMVLVNREAGVDDAALAHCMSNDQRPRLVEAAGALGLAIPSDVPADQDALIEWRRREPDRFNRACAALVDGQHRAQGGTGDTQVSNFLLSTLGALMSTAVGAGLTLVVMRTSDAGGERRVQAESLRMASVAFVQAATNYMRQRAAGVPGDPPPVDALYDRRVELAAQLGQIAALHPDWSRPRVLRGQLSGDLGGDLVGRPGAVPVSTAAQVMDRLQRLADELEQVALAHGSSGRRGPDMRLTDSPQENDVR